MQHSRGPLYVLVIALGLAASAFAPARAADSYGTDRALIEDLQARYLFALDFRDADAYANTFTEDGVLDYGMGAFKGRRAIHDMVVAMKDREQEQRAKDTTGLRPAAGRHSITNIVISVHGNTATSVAYWTHLSNDNPKRETIVNSFGHYEDELVRTNGQWLFTKRKIYNEAIPEWSAALAENPAMHPGTGPGLRKPSTPR